MAAMLSSCATLLSRAPPVPGKSSPAAAPALQLLRCRQPPAAATAAASVAALRWASRIESQSRAALLACHAAYQYNDIQPSALVNPREKNDGDWRLTDEDDQITLKFMVGETSKEKLEVATTEDKVLLIIRYKKEEEEDKSSSQAPARSLDVRLLMPPGYDKNKMQAMMFNGWLQIFIPKPNKNEPKNIPISSSTPPTPPAQ